MSLIQEFDRSKKITLVEKRHEYDDVYTYIFKPEERLHFRSGQSAHVTVPGLGGEEGRRSFSFASPPQEENIWFATHIHTNGPYKQAWKHLKIGDALFIPKIKSITVLPEDETLSLVMIAGGVGIAPFRSMMLDLHHRNLTSTVTLVHVSSGPFLYEEDLKNLPAAQYRITRPEIDTTLNKIVHDNPGALFYIAGTPLFLSELTDLLKKRGVGDEKILTSLFKRYRGFLE